MGKIDHEARIAAGRPLAYTRRLEQDDAITSTQLLETAGGGKASPAGADHQPFRCDVFVKDAWRRLERKQCIPSRWAGIPRQAFDLNHQNVRTAERMPSLRQINRVLRCRVGKIDPDGLEFGILIMGMKPVVPTAKT